MFRRTVTARLTAVAAVASALALSATASAATLPPLQRPTGAALAAAQLKPNLTATQSAGVVTIKNTGLVSSGAFTIGTWRSATKVPAVQTRVAGVAPGASVRLSPGAEGGTVRADIYGEVAESDESDNAVY